MIWENDIKTCIISYKKRITSPGWMQDTGSLGLVHWDDPEGWYGEGGDRKSTRLNSSHITSWQIDGETMETVTDFIFLDPKSLRTEIAAMKIKDNFSGGGGMIWENDIKTCIISYKK